jgi:uncharacterized protein YlxW (UPF0749 family)
VRTDAPPPARPAPARRVDASMSLLVDMMADTLDQGYDERAGRAEQGRPAGAVRGPRRRQRLLPLVGVLAVGVLTGTAVAAVRDRSQADQGLRGELAAQVASRTADSDALARRAAELRTEVEAVRERALGTDADGRAAQERLEALGAASATTAVRGEGVVVTLDDAPSDDVVGDDPLRGGAVSEGRVRDADLQDVVNGLWAAGAEAVAVDGQRLTALTAIRSAGESVLVDLRPLSPPYVVEAVGDPSRLEVRFVDGPSGRRLTTLASLYGIRFEVARSEELDLPAAGTPDLRVVTPGATS